MLLRNNIDGDLTIFIISDFNGEIAEFILNALFFNLDQVKIKKFNNVASIDELSVILTKAKNNGNIILAYTFGLFELCKYIQSEAKKLGIKTMDIRNDPHITKVWGS